MFNLELIRECILSNKSISEKTAKELEAFLSKNIKRAREFAHTDYLVSDRNATVNEDVIFNLSLIKEAMSDALLGKSHEPSKIAFDYTYHKISDLDKSVKTARRYTVSPYYLLINNGYYYLLCFDDKFKDIRTYRVDRMKNVSLLEEPREGQEGIKEIDIDNYTKRVFSMFSGEKQRVILTFNNLLLDTVLDKFGKKNLKCFKKDDNRFSVIVDVEISNQFFSWICGFGNDVIIETPQVAEEYKNYLKDILKHY